VAASRTATPAGDGAVLASTAGGVILLGVQEDGQAPAVAAPGVQITDAEAARIRQVIVSWWPHAGGRCCHRSRFITRADGTAVRVSPLTWRAARGAPPASDAPVRVEGVGGIGWNAGKVLPRPRGVFMFVA
jgi:hypothetical protein